MSTRVHIGRRTLRSRLLVTMVAVLAALLVTTGAAAGAAAAGTASDAPLATVSTVAREPGGCEAQCTQLLASHVAREWVLCWNARDTGAACEAHIVRELPGWEATAWARTVDVGAYGAP